MKETTRLVIEDLLQRDSKGRQTYGGPLLPLNGRNSLQDAYEEALDLAQYLKNELRAREIDERWFKSHMLLFSIWQDYQRTGSWLVSPDTQDAIKQLMEG